MAKLDARLMVQRALGAALLLSCASPSVQSTGSGAVPAVLAAMLIDAFIVHRLW